MFSKSPDPHDDDDRALYRDVRFALCAACYDFT